MPTRCGTTQRFPTYMYMYTQQCCLIPCDRLLPLTGAYESLLHSTCWSSRGIETKAVTPETRLFSEATGRWCVEQARAPSLTRLSRHSCCVRRVENCWKVSYGKRFRFSSGLVQPQSRLPDSGFLGTSYCTRRPNLPCERTLARSPGAFACDTVYAMHAVRPHILVPQHASDILRPWR